MNFYNLKRFVISGLAMSISSVGIPSLASASTCPVTLARPEAGSGSWCNDGWINYFSNAYHLTLSDWTSEVDGGDTPCDTTLHFGRFMNGVWVLNYADGPNGKARDDYSGSILHWGGNFTMDNIDSVTPICADDGLIAYTDVFGDVEVYLPFFFNRGDVQRASTLVHEARHGWGCVHNGNDGSNRCPARSDSCDEAWNDGCLAFAGGRQGAITYQVLWLWWFTAAADAITGTSERKQRAADLANLYLNTMYDTSPCFNITTTGQSIQTC